MPPAYFCTITPDTVGTRLCQMHSIQASQSPLLLLQLHLSLEITMKVSTVLRSVFTLSTLGHNYSPYRVADMHQVSNDLTCHWG